MIVEAADKRALSSGVRSVAVRIARYVNDLLARRGPFWADRWYGRALKSPREVRNALLYVLANFRKHARGDIAAGLDPYSSAPWFDGWREWSPVTGMPPPLVGRVLSCGVLESEAEFAQTSRPRTWLATIGWRRHALLSVAERPAG